MPLLGFVSRRLSPEHNTTDRASLKDQLRKVAASSSTPSLQTGLFGHPEESWSPARMDAVKKSSIGNILSPVRRSSGSNVKVQAPKCARLWITVESPPLISYNTPTNSSGALFSAQLHVEVAGEEVAFESVEVRIVCIATVKKPVHTHCSDCAIKVTELRKINLAKETLRLKQGDHPIPFSYLFAGHLPATTKAGLVQLEYFAIATAKTSAGDTISLSQKGPDGKFIPLPDSRYAIKLMRSILPGNDKHSIRVFPPTNLTANVFLNPVIHPIGEFPVQLRMSGMTTKGKEQISRWRLRKLNWRVEEKQTMVSPACPKHAEKLGGEGKGIFHDDVRIIGEGELDQAKNPWKTDYDAGDVEAEFTFAINPRKHPVCDVEAQNGMHITHNLIIEMVVAEEWALKTKPKAVTPTGAARILRTQFHLLLTERPGLGVSWDEETPPVYEDVPESPPHYAKMIDFDISTEAGQLEELHLDSNTGAELSTAVGSSNSPPSPILRRPLSRPGSSEAHTPSGLGRYRLNADDLISGPPERRESAVHSEDEEEDVRNGDVGQVSSSRR